MRPTIRFTFALAAFLVVSQSTAEAAKLRCKSDPLFIMSDGTSIDVNADIDSLPMDVTTVTYVLRVPTGVRVLAWARTPTWLTTVEKVVVLTGNPPRTYSSNTIVINRRGKVPVTANMVVGLAKSSVTGKAGDTLTLHVTAPSILNAVGQAAGIDPVTEGASSLLNQLTNGNR